MDIYHFLSTDCKKLALENWQNFNLDPLKAEGSDYVLVGEKVWSMVKKTYNGGPAVEFFLVSEEAAGEGGPSKDKNFLYQNDYSLYGYPDKHPTYYDTCLEIVDTSGEAPSTMRIPYRLMLSRHIDVKTMIYYVATKLRVDAHLLTVAVTSDGQDIAEMGVESGTMTLNEVGGFYAGSTLSIRYSGSQGNSHFNQL